MHRVYAVDPEAIGQSWCKFKDLFDRFGTDKGRLISRFPKTWEKMVMTAAEKAKVSKPDRDRIEVRLKMEKRYKVVRSGRGYESKKNWMCNALREHDRESFQAIISCSEAIGCNEALRPRSVCDAQTLMVTRHNMYVFNPSELAEALLPIAKVSAEIDLVDPYFSHSTKYIKMLKLLFSGLEKSRTSPEVIRVHCGEKKPLPCAEFLDGYWKKHAGKVVPKGRRLEIHGWSKLLNGEYNDELKYFHDRFFLTDIGGIQSGIGFGRQPALLSLMDMDVVQKWRGRLVPGSNFYPAAERTVVIDCDGVKKIGNCSGRL